MAITRISTLHTVLNASITANISADADEFAMVRLDNGSIAVVGETFASTDGTKSQFVSVVNSTNTAHTGLLNFAVDTATVEYQWPVLTAGNGNTFAINFDRYDGNETNGGDANAMTKFYNASGTALTGSLNGSTSAAGVEFSSSMSRLGNGNYLMTWTDALATTNTNLNTEVMGRIFSPAGTAIGGEFQINSSTAGAQIGNDSVALGDGRSFVFWGDGPVVQTANGPVINPTGMKGRFVTSAGVPTGAEITVDTVTRTGVDIDDVNAVALANGGFVIGWAEQWDPDNGTRPVGFNDTFRFQVFGASGGKIGGEFVVQTETSGVSNAFKLVELANGGFAAYWQERAPGGVMETHVRTFSTYGGESGTETVLTSIANNGTDGLDEIYHLALMADGKVMGFGYDEGTSGRAGTQIFDFGDERIIGTNSADNFYGKIGVNDIMRGEGGNDTLRGLTGNDSIDGGLGNDTIVTGGGVDTVSFTTALSTSLNRDTITDFYVPADVMRLDDLIFTTVARTSVTNSVLLAGQFWKSATGVAHDADDRIIYNTVTGVLTYDSNGNAAGGTIAQFAVLTPNLALTNADFLVI